VRVFFFAAYRSTVVLQCLLLHSNSKTHDEIQRSALRTGCFLRHLFISVQGCVRFAPVLLLRGNGSKYYVNIRDRGGMRISRQNIDSFLPLSQVK